jgi:hypothetical protein
VPPKRTDAIDMVRAYQVFVEKARIELRQPIRMRNANLSILLERKPRGIPEHRVGVIGHSHPRIPHSGRPAVGFDPQKQPTCLTKLSLSGHCKSQA